MSTRSLLEQRIPYIVPAVLPTLECQARGASSGLSEGPADIYALWRSVLENAHRLGK